VKILFGVPITDATCGFRAFRTELLDAKGIDWMCPSLNRYQFEYFLYAIAIKYGFRCGEVPCSMIYPEEGEYSKIPPFSGWYQMLEPWLKVGLSLRKKEKPFWVDINMC